MAPPSASAQVPELEPLGYKLLYKVTWNGMGIGRIRVTMKEDRFSYHMKVDTKTTGIARLFSSEKRLALARGRITADGQYIHNYYDSRPQDEKNEYTTLTYDEHGDIATRVRVPEAKPTWRVPVPEAEANQATDPITAFLMFRERIHGNMERNIRDTTLLTYEGARLAEMTFRVISRAKAQAMGKYQPAINTVLMRKPIKGYTVKEQKKYAEGDPTVHVFWSADGRFIPLKIDLVLGFGTITATLTEAQEY